MKKVFIFVASRDVKEANSKKVINLLVEEMNKNSQEEIVYSIYDPKTLKIDNCLGCCNCFNTGVCCLDKKDNFNLVKKEMEESDLIILISPVYAQNVTGDMKIFIDRLSYWMHIFKLVGKKSVSISVSSTNGNDFVNSYLKKILELLGTQVVANTSVTVDGPRMLEDEEFLKGIIPQTAKKIIKSMDKKQFTSTREQEKFYENMRQLYMNVDDEFKDKTVEFLYWKESGMLESESLQEYVNYKMKE